MSVLYQRNTVQETAGVPDVDELNTELTKIQSVLQNAVSRIGTAPNNMQAALDMNSNPIINLPFAVSQSSPVTLGQLNAVLANTATIDLGPFVVPVIIGGTPQEAISNLLSGLDGIGLIDDQTSLINDFSDTILDLTVLPYSPVVDVPVPDNSRREIIVVVDTTLGPVEIRPAPGFLPGDRMIVLDGTANFDENRLTVNFSINTYNFYSQQVLNYTSSTPGHRATFTYINPTLGFIGA